MLPLFPTFKRLTLEDKPLIENVTNNFPPYSDFNFVSLFSYNVDEKVELSILHNNLVIKFQDYIDESKFFLSCIGKENTEDTILKLVTYAKEDSIEPILQLIPEDVVNKMRNHNGIIIAEDPNNFDYILTTTGISDESNSKFSHKRRLINRFLREHPHANLHKTTIIDPLQQERIFACFQLWEKTRNKLSEETRHELKAIQRIVNHATHFRNVHVLTISEEETVLGFSLYEICTNGYGFIHFAKFSHKYTGLFESVVKFTLDDLAQNNCKYVNIEQDLGLEGLRNMKTLWYPDHFLKKYIISYK